MKGFILFVALVLLVPSAAFAAGDWVDVWTGGKTATDGTVSVAPGGKLAYIAIPAGTCDANSVSPPLQVQHLASVCLDTNFTTLFGTSEGTGVYEVNIIAQEDWPGDSDLNNAEASSHMGSISGVAGLTCVHAGPGPMIIRIKTVCSQTGGIVVRGY